MVSFGEFIHNLESQFSSSVSPTQSEQDAGTKGQRDRSAAQAQNTTLSQEFHGGYLPNVVSDAMENFDTMSHDRIIQYRGSIDPNGMNASVAAWQKLAKDTGDKAEAFRSDIEGLINNGWAGASAESAKANVRKYAEDAKSLQQAADLVANKLTAAEVTVNQVKNQIPDKPASRSHSWTGIITDVVANTVLPGAGATTLGGQLMADHGRTNNAQAEARAVMNNVYARYLPEADTNVPSMPGVTQADNAPNVPPSSPGPGPGPGPGVPGPGPGPSTAGTPGPGTSTDTQPSGTGNATSPSSLNLPDALTGQPTGATSPSSLSPSTATAGYDGSGLGGLGGGGLDGGGVGGGGLGGGLDGSSAGGGKGGSVPGAGSVGGKPGAGTAGSLAGMSGAGSPSGMMGQKGGQKGEGDGEHQTPEWLKGIQEDLLGPEVRHLPGGVIGGDYAE
ncbi:PPE domain-containing protein [Nocardia alni]|uniref:PPE domain-containing protein n=1 Tax=Nocardia alni TaxID=2815723 RepID=UPI001C23716C|nr:PPE domain-containing protein [Nocardia alni]